MALSERDCDKNQAISQYRQKTYSGQRNTTNKKPESPTSINEYGERVKRKITQPQKSLSELEIERIIEEYRNGISTYALAKRYGCHRSTITEYLRKHGVEVTCSKIDPEQGKKIVALYENGLRVSDIATQYSISCSPILNYLNKQGVKIRGRWGH